MPRTVAERFWSKVEKREGGCWIWKGCVNQSGYGNFKMRGEHGAWRTSYAHRTAWFLTHGPIPPGMCVIHSCDTPRCCRVEHLRLGTNKDNTADAIARGRLSRTGSARATGQTLTPAKHRETMRNSYQKNRAKRLAKSRREYRAKIGQPEEFGVDLGFVIVQSRNLFELAESA